MGLMAMFPSSESQMSSLSSLISSPGSHRFTCEHNSESDTTKKDHEKKLSKSTTFCFGSPSLKVTLSWDSLGCPPPRPSSSPHSSFSSPLPSSSQYQPLRRHLPLLGRPWFSHTPSPQPTGGVKWTQQHLSITINVHIISTYSSWCAPTTLISTTNSSFPPSTPSLEAFWRGTLRLRLFCITF